MINEIKSFEERKNELFKLGKENNNQITYEQIAEHLKGIEPDSDSLDDLYNMFVQNGIEIVTSDEEDAVDDDSVDDGSDIIISDSSNKDIKINK